KESRVRNPLPDIASLRIPPHLEETELPERPPMPSSYSFGEGAALEELNAVLATNDTGQDLYIRLSPFLAIGSLSPILTYHILSAKSSPQHKRIKTQLLDGLLRRDYYRFMFKKY